MNFPNLILYKIEATINNQILNLFFFHLFYFLRGRGNNFLFNIEMIFDKFYNQNISGD